MRSPVVRGARRTLLVASIVLSVLLGGGPPRVASADTSRWAQGEELIARVPRGTSTTSLREAAKANYWTCTQVAKSADPAYAKDLWVLRPMAGKRWTATSTFLSLLQKTKGVALAVRNTRTALVRPATGVYSTARGAGGYVVAGQSEMPAFDDELVLASVRAQPALDTVRIREVQQLGWQGTGIVIAVLDGGFDLSHQVLQGHLATGPYDALAGDTDPVDRGNGKDDDYDGTVDRAKGHGTAVAGVVALAAPGAKVLPMRVLDDEGRGNAASLALGVRKAIERNVRVICLASGSPEFNPLVEEALREAWSRGILVVCAAGSDGTQPANYPSSSVYCLCVAGVTSHKTVDGRSSYGPTVDLSAPSVDVLGPSPKGPTKYAHWYGTSFATSFVAGGAALLLQRNPGMSAVTAGATLVADVQPYDSIPPDRQGLYGAGVLDVAAAFGVTSPVIVK